MLESTESLEHDMPGGRQHACSDEQKASDPSSFPDGGARAWMVVIGAFFGLFTTFGWTNCVGLFQAYYQSHELQSMSPSAVSWIPATSMFTLFVMAPFVGRLYDRFGPHHLLYIGSFLHVFGLMMTSLSSRFYQFILSQGICSPIGASMILYPCFSTVTTWFKNRRALAMGIVASGSSLGGVLLPILVDRVMGRIGFAWTMRICAFVMLALLILVNLTVRSRLPPRPQPASFGTYLRPFKEKAFLLTALASFFYSMGMFIPMTFMVTYGEHMGMEAGLAGYLVPIFNAASGIGRILPGYVADRLGNFNIAACAALLSTIIVFALWVPAHSAGTPIVFAGLFGFSSGTYTAIGPALVAQISDIREIGVRSGSMYALMSVAALTGSPIGGALLSAAQGTYLKLQVFTGSMLAVGTFFYIMAKLSLGKGRICAKV